jgi:hypothetical protein
MINNASMQFTSISTPNDNYNLNGTNINSTHNVYLNHSQLNIESASTNQNNNQITKSVTEIFSKKNLSRIEKTINFIFNKLKTKNLDFNSPQEQLTEQLNTIQSKFNNYDHGQIIKHNNKAQNILCPIASSATKGNIYHANKIQLSQGSYIAAQGPTTKLNDKDTSKHFIRMLAENNSFISISLVDSEKFNSDNATNHILPPYEFNKPITIRKIKSNKMVIAKAVSITKIDFISNSRANILIDFLEINKLPHIRIYDLGWKNDLVIDPLRATKLSAVIKYIVNLPIFRNFNKQPIVVNCNLGVIKTGVFIAINNMMRDYFLNNKIDIPYLTEIIYTIKKSRPNFMQSIEELKILMHIVEKHQYYFNTMIKKDAEYLSNNKSTTLDTSRNRDTLLEAIKQGIPLKKVNSENITNNKKTHSAKSSNHETLYDSLLVAINNRYSSIHKDSSSDESDQDNWDN